MRKTSAVIALLLMFAVLISVPSQGSREVADADLGAEGTGSRTSPGSSSVTPVAQVSDADTETSPADRVKRPAAKDKIRESNQAGRDRAPGRHPGGEFESPDPDPAPEPAPDPAPDPAPEPDPAPDPDLAPRPAIAAEAGPAGALLESDDGALRLEFPPGSLAETVTVTATRLGDPERTIGVLRIAGAWSIECPAPLQAPVTVSIRHELGVEHFQVAGRLLQAATLMTREADGEVWIPGTGSATLDGSYISGQVEHFSEWTAGTIQPHGTNPATIDYCSGVCHDLVTEAGSTIRIDARDKQACYLCHGSSDPHSPPAGASGENVQASLFDITGQERPASASSHPVRSIGDTFGLWCTSCHDPHADPAHAPGLLRATDASGKIVKAGNEFCWACHGTARNRRVDFLAPGYYTRSGGSKHGAFQQTLHGTDRDTTVRERRMLAGFAEGTHLLTEYHNGALRNGSPTSSNNIVAGFTATTETRVTGGIEALTDPAIDRYVSFYPEPSEGVLTFELDLDFSQPVPINRWDFSSPGVHWSARPQRAEAYWSVDGETWESMGSAGTLGTASSGLTLMNITGVKARYVKFRVQRLVWEHTNSDAIGCRSLYISTGSPIAGLWTSPVEDFSYDGSIRSVSFDIDSDVAEGGAVVGESRLSLDGGTNWTQWTEFAEGEPIPQITDDVDARNARLQYRVWLFRPDTSVDTEVYGVRSETLYLGPAQRVYPESGVDEYTCSNCHEPHGSPGSGLARASGDVLCVTCHDEAQGSYRGAGVFASSLHAPLSCAGCHDPHGATGPDGAPYASMLKADGGETCYACHANVEQAFKALPGADPWLAGLLRHNVDRAERESAGTRIECGSCHGTHSMTGDAILVDPNDVAQPFTATRPDPKTIPTQEVVLSPTKDTVIRSGVGETTRNWGASATATVDADSRVLLHFDLSAIPPGAEILNAALVLKHTEGDVAGGFAVRPVMRAWNEGSGDGGVNDPAIDGATWLEWQYHDNAWSGQTSAGDWQEQGGDLSAQAARQWLFEKNNAVNVTALVQELRSGVNHGIALLPYPYLGECSIPLTMRETPGGGAVLRVTYATGPATGVVADCIDFCSGCHDGTMPDGVFGPELIDVQAAYERTVHGSRKGLGPGSHTMGFDTGGGGLRQPYYYGMGPLPCMECHDPHGSSNPYHLREEINGSIVSYTYEPYVDGTSSFCSACHILPDGHGDRSGSCFRPCHTHAGSRF